MKNLQRFRIIFLSVFLLQTLSFDLTAAGILPANLKAAPSVDYMLQNSNLGNDFYIAIPQNDIKNGMQEEVLAIYILSYTNTKARIRFPKYSLDKTYNLIAYQPLELSSENSDVSFIWEVTESEAIGNEAIHISSEDPIAVYVLNSRNTSADGFLAIPVAGWGYKYIHCAYYDFYETNYRRGGGFIIVSAYDGTNVTIKLRGAGEEFGQTVNKRKIGETINVTLKAGQTYMVRGDGSTDNGFDLTGTEITSTMPIGVISFHQRTMIPTKCPNGRDHLSEMLIPVEAWGTDFVTMEFNRKGQGDFMRVVAVEDNTHLVADSYYPGSSNPIPNGHIETYINAGKFWEYLQTVVINNNKQNGVRGITVWKSDKPVLLMQYAYSFPWDGLADWDPLMILIPPITQFQKSAVIQTPVNAGFVRNELTFFAYGDPDDPEREILNSVLLDGVKISKNYQQFNYNQIPGTNLFWGRLDVEPGLHTLTSDTKLTASLYGFTGYNSYGWPATMGTAKLDKPDTLVPEIIFENEECGNFTISALEKRSIPSGPNPQTDLGISHIILIKEYSNNYSLTLDKPDKFTPAVGVYDQIFHLNIIDNMNDANAYFAVVDRAGNFTIDSVKYTAPKIQFDSKGLNFKNSRLYKDHLRQFVIINTSNEHLNITNIALDKSSDFEIKSISPSDIWPFTVNPGDTIRIEISYKPIFELSKEDSLRIESDCISFKVPVTGNGIMPHIETADWNAPSTEVNKTICLEALTGEGLRISNTGTDSLHIYDLLVQNIIGDSSAFTISQPTEPPLPITMEPGKIIYLESICFSPKDTGNYQSNLIIKSDALDLDTISVLNGKGFIQVDVIDNFQTNEFNINPNPSLDGNIVINYKINVDSKISINLYQNDGKLIKELVNENKNSGNYSINCKLGELPSGVYHISYKNQEQTISKKLIIKR